MPYRLHIDIVMSEDEDESIEATAAVAKAMGNAFSINDLDFLTDETRFRLSHDSDRATRNYLVKNENGHVGTKKLKLEEASELE